MYDWKKDLENPAYDDGSHTRCYNDGTKYWKNNKKQLHREDDKPSIIFSDYSMEWHINGKYHRENDKPAIIWFSGTMEWRINGKPHREDNKPSVIRASGYREWWIKGKNIIPELKHMIAAIEDDPEFINHKQFENFMEEFEISLKKGNKSDIPSKYQEIILEYYPRLSQYIQNLDPRFKQTKQAAGFGMFD